MISYWSAEGREGGREGVRVRCMCVGVSIAGEDRGRERYIKLGNTVVWDVILTS